MNRYFNYEPDPKDDQPKDDNFQKSIQTNPREINTNEGSEFLNDAIRMEDDQWENSGIPPDEISLYVSHPFLEPNDEFNEL